MFFHIRKSSKTGVKTKGPPTADWLASFTNIKALPHWVYFKSPLIALCQAYGVRTSSRSTKLVIAQDLLNVIPEHAFIPNTIPVDDRQFRIMRNSESEGHIRILFHRVSYIF